MTEQFNSNITGEMIKPRDLQSVVQSLPAAANVQIKSIIWNMQPKISFTDKISPA